MTAIELARSVLTTECPVVMPREPYPVGDSNAADFHKFGHAVIAGIVRDMAMNPQPLTPDQASIVVLRMTRALHLLDPERHKPAPNRPKPPHPVSAPAPTSSDSASNPTEPRRYPGIETPEEWNARFERKFAEQAAQRKSHESKESSVT